MTASRARELAFLASGARARDQQRHRQPASLVRREQQIQPLCLEIDPAQEQDVLTATDQLLVRGDLLSMPFGMTCTVADGLYRRTVRTVGLD